MSDNETKATTVLLCKWKDELVHTFLNSDCNLYIVLDDFDVKTNNPPAELLRSTAGWYRVPEFDSLDAVATVAADLKLRGVRIDHIVSHAEYSQFGAGYLDILLRGTAVHPFNHVATRDKRLMKSVIKEAGIPAAAFVPLTSTADDLGISEATRTLKFPTVVKPATGLGTLSTVKVERPEDLIPTLGEFEYAAKLKSPQLSVEEFVEGSELHVDAFWAGVKPLYFTVSAYYHNQLSIVREADPSQSLRDGSRLIFPHEDPELYEQVLHLHLQINEALAVSHGATHLELFKQPDGRLVFSEMASRIGGAWIPSLLTHYLGSSVWEVIAHGTLGISHIKAVPTKKYLGGFALSPAAAGTIVEVPSETEALACPGVLSWKAFCKVGDVVPEHAIDRRSAFIVVGADTEPEYEEAVDMAYRRLNIKLA